MKSTGSYGIVYSSNKKEKELAMKSNGAHIKKSMLTVMISIAALLLILVILIQVLTRCKTDPSSPPSETTDHTVTLEFSDEYVTDREVFEADEKYFTYDRTVYFYDPQTGVTEGIEEGKYDDFGAAAELLCRMIESIIAGDAETYNTFFSDIYFEQNEEKSEFSMQKLYDILLSEHSVSEETDDNGVTYKEYIYEVRYKIRNNNGSFRSDVDSDKIRKQYFLITNRSGQLSIDKIYTYNAS